MMRLVAGDASPRLVYRWLYAQPRTGGRYSDLYLTIRWTPEVPDTTLPESVHDALWAFDRPCKILDFADGRMEVRTRCWRRFQRPDRVRSMDRDYHDYADRWYGRRYATRLAALLRAAHREGVVLTVEVTP
jgi:hypothetical protein